MGNSGASVGLRLDVTDSEPRPEDRSLPAETPAQNGVVDDEGPALHRVVSKPSGHIAIVLVALAAGLVGLWLGGMMTGTGPVATTAGTLRVIAATASFASPASGSAGTHWIVGGSVAPALVEAYYATLETSAGLGAVVCTTGDGLSCHGVPRTDVRTVYSEIDAASPLPGPEELWTEVGVVNVSARGAVDTIVADDLSPALFNDIQVISSPVAAGSAWSNSGSGLKQVSSNGTLVFTDLGSLAPGRHVVLIRSVFSVPPDPHGLVETWSALAIEVSGDQIPAS